MKFKTILADPPWHEVGGGKIRRGADRHYPLMKTKDIASLPVKDLIHPDGCHLYLWVTNNFLADGLHVMDAWGFKYKNIITWAKEGKAGLGQYFRGKTEHILFGVNKALPYKISEAGKRQQGLTLINAPRREHSRKPEEAYDLIELVSYPDYLELFACREREGWTSIGDSIDQLDIRQSIKELVRDD